MTKTGRLVRWIAVWAMVAFSIFLLFVMQKFSDANIGTDPVFLCVREITRGYRIHQIVTSFVFFILGFAISLKVFGMDDIGYASVWAMPVAVSVWSVGSMILLFVGIPYTRFSSILICLVLFLLFAPLNRTSLRKASLEPTFQVFLIALSVIIIISTGVVPTIMSSDSYFYVMQYGEVLAKTGKLSFDLAGTFMTWTGISSALMSSASFIFGFENIITFHYLLIISMAGLFGITIYRRCIDNGICKKRAVAITSVSLIALMTIPSVELLSSWVISNTHCMVFILFLMVGIQDFVSEHGENYGLLWILVYITIWLGMSRAEMSVCMVGMIGIISYLPIRRRELMLMGTMLFTFQGTFLLKLDLQQMNSNMQVYDSMLTPGIQIIMMVALTTLVLYCLFLNRKPVGAVRNNLKKIVIIFLPLTCLGIYFMNPEKYLTSIDALVYNLKNEYWGVAPIFLLFMAVAALVASRRITFYGIFSYGYLFLNLLFALARKQPLRYGYGDSCNRMLISAVPMILLASITAIISCFRKNIR